jgi:hypothetical protein
MILPPELFRQNSQAGLAFTEKDSFPGTLSINRCGVPETGAPHLFMRERVTGFRRLDS